MLVKYATLWLFTLPLSPCNLYDLLLISVLFALALAGDITFFFYRVHNVMCSTHVCIMYVVYACM